MTRFTFILLALGIATLGGCGTSLPPVVPVTGVVTINDKPLANAEVKFIPMLDGLGGNHVASGVTDKTGAFTLKFPGKVEPGCCACQCKVLIVEAPIPDEGRGEDEASIMAAGRYRKSQRNRPIPKEFERIGTTPLSYDVDESNKHFEIKLRR